LLQDVSICPTIEEGLVTGRFLKQADELQRFRPIAAMDPIAPVPVLGDWVSTWDKAAALARQWEPTVGPSDPTKSGPRSAPRTLSALR